MSIRYVSKELDWTPEMKECVRLKIAVPLQRHLKNAPFELSVHLGFERKTGLKRKPRYEMWVVLQTFDGRANEMVRLEGADFHTLATEVSGTMRNKLRKQQEQASARRRYLPNPFKFLPFERTA